MIRKMMLKVTIFMFGFFLNCTFAETSEDSTPVCDETSEKGVKTLMQSIIDKYLNQLQSESLSIEDKKNVFRTCFENHFSTRKIAGFVLGIYVRSIKTEYKDYFLKYLIEQITNMYTKQFDNLRDITVSIKDIEFREINNQSVYKVVTSISNKNFSKKDDDSETDDDIKCVWTFIEENIEDKCYFKIIDVTIGGISLKTTLRDVIQSSIASDFSNDVNLFVENKCNIANNKEE